MARATRITPRPITGASNTLLSAALVLLALTATARADAPPVTRVDGPAGYALKPEAAELLQELARPHALEKPVTPGWVWSGLSVERSRALFALEGRGGRAELLLLPPEIAPAPHGGEEEVASPADAPPFRLEFQAIDAEGRPAVEALAAALRGAVRPGLRDQLWARVYAGEGAAQEVGIADDHIVLGLQLVWLALLALLLWQLSTHLFARGPGREGALSARALLGLGALFVGSAAIRLVFATWGPGDLWMNFHTAFSGAGSDHRYGSAPNAFLGALFWIAPRHHDTIVGLNLVLGGLAPVIAVLLAVALGRGRPGTRQAAWLTGLLMALQPLLVRHGGEANRQPFVVLLLLVSLWSLVRFLSVGGWRRWTIAALAAFLCSQSRPEALLVLPIWAVFIACSDAPRRLWRGEGARRRAVALLAVGGILAAWFALRDVSMLSLQQGSPNSDYLALRPLFLHPDNALWVDPRLSPAAVAVLAVMAAVWGALRRDRSAIAATLCLLGVGYVASAFSPQGADLTLARYHTLTLPFVALLAGTGWAWTAEAARHRWSPRAGLGALLLAGVAVAASTAAPLFSVTAARTLDHEYRLVCERGDELPPEATVYVVPLMDDHGLKMFHEYAPLVFAQPQRWQAWLGGAAPRGVYFHSSACSNPGLEPTLRRACDEAWRRWSARPIFELEVPALPFGPERYAKDRVTVGFYDTTSSP